MAHKAALDVGGKTIAVMPCGIDLVHPAYQEDLHQEILRSGGLIISEYEGDQMPVNWMYPRRNRIVAGLSQATLVVEAGLKSGAIGGKLVGAGGGGFLMFYCDNNKRQLRETMEKIGLKELNFRFDGDGCKVIYEGK